MCYSQSMTIKEPTDAIVYDMNAPVRVLDRKGKILWEGKDVLDAMTEFRKFAHATEIRRDGVLLAHAGKQVAVVRMLANIAASAYRNDRQAEVKDEEAN